MKELQYKGLTYVNISGKWTDDRHIVVHETLQRELNDFFYSQTTLRSMGVADLVKEGDYCKSSSSIQWALKCYEAAADKADSCTLAYILPRMTSCYRKIGYPEKAIQILSFASQKFGKSMVTPAMLVSVAGAYCDLGDYQRARKCCDRALAQLDGRITLELRNVYARINSETK